MDRVNNPPPATPSLLADIIQARTNIKKKYNELKTGRFETESLINNTFSSIIEPLTEIRKNTKKSHLHSLSPLPPPPQPITGSPIVINRFTPASSPSTSHYDLDKQFDYWSETELDKIYGPRKLSNGVFVLGDKKIQFIDDKIHIDGDVSNSYTITPGLVDLLFAKSPASKKYTQADLNTYKGILIQTSAHKTLDGTRIRGSRGMKFKKIISKLFSEHKTTTGSGAAINIKLQKNNIVYWHDPDELVDRLRLLYSSLAAGNTAVRNEIISICEELVEAKILKKIPNV